jgi:hypothetical protein
MEGGLRNSFESLPPIIYWLGLRHEFTEVAEMLSRFCCNFNYLLVQENIFSYIYLKTKLSRLKAEYFSGLYFTSVIPGFKALCRS